MAAIGAAAEKMKPQVAVLDRAVADTGHLVGDSFTLADINILPMLFYVNRFEEGKALLGAAKNLSAYMERHFARDELPQVGPAAPGSNWRSSPRERCAPLPHERSEWWGGVGGHSAHQTPPPLTPPRRFARGGECTAARRHLCALAPPYTIVYRLYRALFRRPPPSCQLIENSNLIGTFAIHDR